MVAVSSETKEYISSKGWKKNILKQKLFDGKISLDSLVLYSEQEFNADKNQSKILLVRIASLEDPKNYLLAYNPYSKEISTVDVILGTLKSDILKENYVEKVLSKDIFFNESNIRYFTGRVSMEKGGPLYFNTSDDNIIDDVAAYLVNSSKSLKAYSKKIFRGAEIIKDYLKNNKQLFSKK